MVETSAKRSGMLRKETDAGREGYTPTILKEVTLGKEYFILQT